jgi:hypothetical protein
MEKNEKLAIIRNNKIKFDGEEQDALAVFKEFILETMGPLGTRYGPVFIRMGLTDVNKLLRMQNKEIESILKRCGATSQHITEFLDLLQEKRDLQA